MCRLEQHGLNAKRAEAKGGVAIPRECDDPGHLAVLRALTAGSTGSASAADAATATATITARSTGSATATATVTARSTGSASAAATAAATATATAAVVSAALPVAAPAPALAFKQQVALREARPVQQASGEPLVLAGDAIALRGLGIRGRPVQVTVLYGVVLG